MRNKFLVFLVAILLYSPSFAQFKKGFDNREALEMIAICNSFTFQKVLGDDEPIIPPNYTKVYQSESIGLDNKWQLLENDNYAVINIRGSTANSLSWMANIYSAMIPAVGTITLPNGHRIDYYLSDNPKANVHSGWTLAMTFLSEEIITEIKKMNSKGVYNFIITGHSQGAAIAQLLRSYLEHAPDYIVDKQNNFKTYAFASPKPGNMYFARNYSNYYSSSSFIINNPEDPVTNMPLTKSSDPLIEFEEAYEQLTDSNQKYIKTLGYKVLGKLLAGNEDSLFIKKSGTGVLRQIVAETGPIEMPAYQADMYYCFPVGQINIIPFEASNFINKKYYNSFNLDATKPFYQHKPYLYFLEIMKEYFYDEYKEW